MAKMYNTRVGGTRRMGRGGSTALRGRGTRHHSPISIHAGAGIKPAGTRGFMKSTGISNPLSSTGGRAANTVTSYNSQKIVKTTGVYGATYRLKHFDSGR